MGDEKSLLDHTFPKQSKNGYKKNRKMIGSFFPTRSQTYYTAKYKYPEENSW